MGTGSAIEINNFGSDLKKAINSFKSITIRGAGDFKDEKVTNIPGSSDDDDDS
jgi:hypothetical protein